MKRILTIICIALIAASAHADAMRLYCQCTQEWWTSDDAAIAIYAYADGDVMNAVWPGERMMRVTGTDGMWYAEIDSTQYTNVIFVRVNGSGAVEDWGAKTQDLAIPTDGRNLFTITSTEAVWGDPGVEGIWSVLDESGIPVSNKDEGVNVYSVVGSATLLGYEWDVSSTATEMSPSSDSTTWTYTIPTVRLVVATKYEYKIVADHSWENIQYPTDGNYTLAVPRTGTYQITFTLTPTNGCTFDATLIEDEFPDFSYSKYAVLVNHERFVPCSLQPIENFVAQYLALVQLNVGDTIRMFTRGEQSYEKSMPDLEESGEYANFSTPKDGYGYLMGYYVCNVAGCYSIYFKQSYAHNSYANTSEAESVWISSASTCHAGEDYASNISATTARISVTDGHESVAINAHGRFIEKPSETLPIGSTVELEVFPNSGYMFVEWSDGSIQNNRRIVVTEDISLSATVVSIASYPLGLLVNGNSFIRTAKSETTDYGYQNLIRAQLTEGETFVVFNSSTSETVDVEMEAGGLSGNFSIADQTNTFVCNVSGCYDVYVKKNNSTLSETMYIGEGTVCSDGEDWSEPQPQNYYLIGSVSELGFWILENALPMDGDSIVLNLSANAYEFKVLLQKTRWDNALDYKNFNAQCSSEGVEEGSDDNIKFTLSDTGNVTIRIVDGQICVIGNFGGEVPITGYSVVGDESLFGMAWSVEDTRTEMSQQEGNVWTYMLDSVLLNANVTYYYKVIANHNWSVAQYPSSADGDNYELSVTEDGVYSILFTLIPGEGCTAKATPINDNGNQGNDSALQLWAIWLDSITAYKYPESFMGDFTPHLADNNFYIWSDTYTLRETSGLGYYNTTNDVLALSVGNVGWSGGGMNLNAPTSIGEATSLMNMIVAQPENYFFHLAVRSTTAGNHQFYLFGSDATSFGIGDYGSETIDFGEGVTGPAIGDFTRNGEWQEFWIPMTLFADKIANLPTPTESFNIFCILSGGTPDVQIDLDAMYFCNAAMKEEFIRFKQESDYLQANPKTFWPVLLDGSFCYYNNSSCMGYMTEDESNTNLYIWGDSYTIDVAHEQGFYENSSAYVTMTITDKGWAGAGWNTVTTASLGVIIQLMDSIIARPDNYYLHLALKSTTAGNHQFYFLGNDATSFGIGNYDSEIVDFGDGITGPAIGNFPRDGQWYDFWIPMTLFADKIANMPKPTDNINYFCILSTGAEGANVSMDAIYFCSASMKEDFIKLAPQVKTNYYIIGAIPPFQSLENAMYMDGDSIVLDLPANAYEFKVLPQNTSWDCELGFSAIDTSCSSEGLETEGTNNIVFSMVNGGELKVKVVDSKLCVTGPIGGQVPITGYSVVGDMALTRSNWDITDTSTDMVQQGDYWTCTIDSVYLEADSTYYYKIYANHTWLVKQYPGYQSSYSLTTQETGLYSITFTLIPGEGGTAVAKHIMDDGCPIASGSCGADGDNLTWVLGCDSVLTISGEGAMPSSYSANATPWYQYGQAIKHINIEEGVTKLALNAFYNSGTSANYPNVRTLSIPSTLGAPIENSYFYGCKFTSVTLNSDTIVGKVSYTSGSSLQNKFGAQVEQYIIGGSVRSIANFAFRNQDNDSLRSIILPEGLEAIGNWAFGYIEHLTSISIPSTVQTIGTDAFAGCTNLRSVELGEGLITINGQAFWMCDSLTRVTCNALTPPTLNQTAFDHNQNDTLFVPCEAKTAYQEAEYWKNFSKILCADDTIGGNTEPDVPEVYTFTLDSAWQFIMLPTVFGLTQEDIGIDGEIEWGIYNSGQRATGRTGWQGFVPQSGFSASLSYIVRARNGSATLTIHIPEQARQQAAAAIPINYYAASLPQNANWNFLGNPYPFNYDILSALESANIESPIAVWNGTGYTTYTPGIDSYVLEPFKAFFIQLPDGGSQALPFSPEYIRQ